MHLPEPVWSEDDIKVAKVNGDPFSLILSTWSKDPTKLAILRGLDSCQARLDYPSARKFRGDIADALAHNNVCFLYSFSLEVEEVHY